MKIAFLLLSIVLMCACSEKRENTESRKSPDLVAGEINDNDIKLPSGKEIAEKDIANFIYTYSLPNEIRIYEAPSPEARNVPYQNIEFTLLENNKTSFYWFFVITNTKITGWINLNDCASVLRDKYYAAIKSAAGDSGLTAWNAQARNREYKFNNANNVFKRIGPLLVVGNGEKAVSFCDRLYSDDKNMFEGVYNQTFYDIFFKNYYIIEKHYWEEEELVLYDLRTNQEMFKIKSLPIISPNQQKFATCGVMYNEDETLQIFKIADNNLVEEFKQDLQVERGEIPYSAFEKLTWLDDNNIELLFKPAEDPPREIKLRFQCTADTGWRQLEK